MSPAAVAKKFPATTEGALAKHSVRREQFSEAFAAFECSDAPLDDNVVRNQLLKARERAEKQLATAATALRRKGFTLEHDDSVPVPPAPEEAVASGAAADHKPVKAAKAATPVVTAKQVEEIGVAVAKATRIKDAAVKLSRNQERARILVNGKTISYVQPRRSGAIYVVVCQPDGVFDRHTVKTVAEAAAAVRTSALRNAKPKAAKAAASTDDVQERVAA